MSVIYWFSGTGNSLYAAKCLAAGLNGMPLYPISTGVPAEAVGGSGEKVGFVLPSYYGNLPRIVRSFIEKLEIKPETYLFAVVTMGGMGQGTVAALDTVLRKKNLRLNYGGGIHMPPNYIVNYNPADPAKCENSLDKVALLLKQAASDISAGVQSVRMFKFTANNLYRNIESLDSQFFVEDSCTGCGLCGRICPAKNIQMENNKPQWLHHCEHCMACISWCPVKAIQYGKRTKTRRRYHNPRNTIDEMLVK